jgi:Family of unknown function (DUF6167)
MSRGVWFVAGAASGVYALLKVRRTARAFTPGGMSERLAAYRAGASVFAESVAKAMAERERELLRELEREQQRPRLIAASPEQPDLRADGVTPAVAGAR